MGGVEGHTDPGRKGPAGKGSESPSLLKGPLSGVQGSSPWWLSERSVKSPTQ